MKHYFLIAYFFISTSIAWSGEFLLNSPPLIVSHEIEDKISALSLPMKWSSKNEITAASWHLGFDHKDEVTFLKIQFVNTLPNDLTHDEKEQFIHTVEENQDVWTYGYPKILEDSTQLPASLEDHMGVAGKPLLAKKAQLQFITVHDLVRIIQNKSVVFYTGAGISAPIVPTMDKIMWQLGFSLDMKEEKGKIDFLKRVLAAPNEMTQVMNYFYRACLYGKPTLAHVALKEIAVLKNWGILTENLDLLHQRSGINPLNHGMPNWLKSNISERALKKIDVVITVGLQSDESGFLGWYKKNNPEGIIVAVNLQAPPYIGAEDFILSGDAQTLIPEFLMCLHTQ